MAVIAISGRPGSRHEEIARATARLLGFELIGSRRFGSMLAQEFGPDTALPDKAFAPAAVSVLARLATTHHLVVEFEGADLVVRDFPNSLRVFIVAPEPARIGTVMIEHRRQRADSIKLLKEAERQANELRKRRFGRAAMKPECFDAILNSGTLEPEDLAPVIRSLAEARGLTRDALLPASAEAHLQFQARLKLSKFGIAPPGRADLRRRFVNASEEIFANLLDFYRIDWQYEPRSFPVRWGKNGEVLEAFTPDFYLPEFDLYVELTTMKQSLVTKKNRKVKLLRSLYPGINIQVFYQKDFENLIFKHGLAEHPVHS